MTIRAGKRDLLKVAACVNPGRDRILEQGEFIVVVVGMYDGNVLLHLELECQRRQETD